MIIYALGANDGLRARDVKGTEKDISAAMKIATDKKVPVLLLGMRAPQLWKTFPKNFQKIYKDIASKYKVEFMPFMLEDVAGNPSLNQADGIHPNAKGYKVMADNIYPYIVKALK